MLRRVAEHTGIHFDETTFAAIMERVQSHAKFPGQPFIPETTLPDCEGKTSELFHRLNIACRQSG
jgi:hypothetical protein